MGPRRLIVWLFPLTYAAHIAEELWSGPGFGAWFSRAAHVHVTNGEVAFWNLVGLGVMVAGLAVWRWVISAVAWIVLMNALFHSLASITTRSYSPGLITALVLWVPLGVYTLIFEWRHAARSTFFKGFSGAVVFHAALLAVYVNLDR